MTNEERMREITELFTNETSPTTKAILLILEITIIQQKQINELRSAILNHEQHQHSKGAK